MSGREAVAYADGDVALTGWLSRPAGAPRAAVLVFPTIANTTPNVERKAQALADAGYLAMIADFYGVEVPDFPSAGPLAQALRADPQVYRRRLAAALEALRAHAPGVPLATIGFCMGGQAALELARSGADIAVAASFHGLLDTQLPASAGAVKARLLVCHGDADPMVARSAVAAFQKEMDAAGADWHLHVYSGVRHGFTDPGSDARGLDAIKYDASADRQSWSALLALFDEVL
ncbi:MAG: dienelactone hydrolase family protein [Sphingomonadales bacterium]|nr:dienelactone hydrolase family protein [Sphingomonadales bacterium]